MPPKAAAKRETSTRHDPEKSTSKKRKAGEQDTTQSKSQRKSGRSGARPSSQQLLNFLLSKAAEDLSRPEDEVEDLTQRGEIKTYSSAILNVFEELMCAIVLSRPISHRLGLRTIRTLLNDPYNFNSAKAVQGAGSDKQHQALWDARTQHKDKTAKQLGELADVVLDQFSSPEDKDGKDLAKALADSDGDIDKLRSSLKTAIKGLGATGLDIFSRRVQWLWEDIYPFIDNRTADSLRKFDLPYDADGLVKTIEDNWKKLDTKHLAGSNDAQKKRRAFVVALERAIGADLEGKVETTISEATK